MLTKYDEIQIPDRGAPFINDRLARKKLAENLTRRAQFAAYVIYGYLEREDRIKEVDYEYILDRRAALCRA